MGSLHFDRYNRAHALGLVDAYSKQVTGRVLAAFAKIEEEAEGAADAYYERRMSEPCPEDDADDGCEIAEAATDHGIDVYSGLEFVRGEVTGLAIAGLYHLWERLVKEFIVRELQPRDRERESVLCANFEWIVGKLGKFGWPLGGSDFFGELDRLRLVANVIKHGDGSSCNKLLEQAPELFRDYGHRWMNTGRGASDLHLTGDHFERFVRAVVAFFAQFPEYLEEGPASAKLSAARRLARRASRSRR